MKYIPKSFSHAHHITSAQLALEETVEFDKAVEYARNVTNEEDTLILVTAGTLLN